MQSAACGHRHLARRTVPNVSHEFVTILLMGIILGAWPPSGTV
ncbi:hypothetical protein [Microbacterium suaedae]|nr:hypothetical protein [Microbacterium suaedae]